MNKLNTLFILLIIAITFIHCTEESSINSIDSIQPFSGVHTELVQLLHEVRGADPAGTIEELIQKLIKNIKKLESDQKTHEATNTRMMKQCSEESKFRRKEISDAQNSYNLASNAFSKCQASLQAARENHPNLVKAKVDYENELKRKTQERERQHKLYLERRKDWKSAIKFLQNFIALITSKLGKLPSSFAEFSERLLQHTAKVGRISEAVPVLAAIANAPAKIDENKRYKYENQAKLIKNLKETLANLVNRLIVDSKINDRNEYKSQKEFDILKSRLQKIIANLEADIKKTNDQILKMKLCTAKEGHILNQAGNKVRRNNRLLNSAQHVCNDFAVEFVKATKNRLEEIQTVEEIVRLIKRKQPQLPSEFTRYLNNAKHRFREIIESRKFRKLARKGHRLRNNKKLSRRNKRH